MTALTARIRTLWREHPWGTGLAFLAAAYVATVLLNAWVCDDAYITFRVVENVIHGHGAVYNVGERVQAYTNPLMLLVMTAFALITREVYFTSLLVSLTASIAAVAILAFRVSRSRMMSCVALIVLIFCTSFVTYSTSGLENCFVFLLSALFFWKYFAVERYGSRDLLVLTLLFSTSLVNRMDTSLLLLPALCFAYARHDGVRVLKLIGVAALGLLPFLGWEAFSVAYYGFPFPNTAYAKLNTGIPSSEYWIRGAWYYLLSFLQDPLLLMAIAAGSVVVLLDRRLKTTVPLIGVLLYLVYIVQIGGDFMRGRYFTAPLFVVMLVLVAIEPERLARYRIGSRRLIIAVLALVLAQNAVAMYYDGSGLRIWDPYGIYDDRSIYFLASNLPLNIVSSRLPNSPLAQEGVSMRREGTSPVVRATLGFAGYYAGPEIHIVDPLALSDALLARLPAIDNPAWEIGHATRYIPEGYLETIESGENVIEDENLARYYDHLSTIITGPLWTAERWRTIVGMNTGAYDSLIDRDRYRYDVEPQFDIDEL